MAPKKKAAVLAPASDKPAKKRKRVTALGETSDGRPNRAEKSAKNKANHKRLLDEANAELRVLMPPAGAGRVIHPEHGHKPTEYTDEIGEKICLKFATDPAMSLLKLNSDPEMPTVWWFYKWLIAYPHLEKAYSRAREIHADLQAAELEEWSTNPLIGKKTVHRTKSTDNGDEESHETQEYDNIERARLRVQTRQWLLSKYRPKKYGTQPLSIETTGDDALSELIASFRTRNQELDNA